jgi:hypothetical protein
MYQLLTNFGDIHIRQDEEIVMFHSGELYIFKGIVSNNIIYAQKPDTGEIGTFFACIFGCRVAIKNSQNNT